MVVPDRVVEDELVVPRAPVVADAGVGVDDECGDVEHFEAGVGGEACLAGAWRFQLAGAVVYLFDSGTEVNEMDGLYQ